MMPVCFAKKAVALHSQQPRAEVHCSSPSPNCVLSLSFPRSLRVTFRAKAPPSQTRGGGSIATSGVQTRGARRQGAPEAGYRAASSWLELGSRRGSRLVRGSRRPAPGSPQPGDECSPEAQSPSGPSRLPAPRGASPARPRRTCLGRGVRRRRASIGAEVTKGRGRSRPPPTRGSRT